MEMSQIVEIIAIVGVIGGIAVAITINNNRKINKKRDSNTIKGMDQKAISGKDTYQSGRDINVRK